MLITHAPRSCAARMASRAAAGSPYGALYGSTTTRSAPAAASSPAGTSTASAGSSGTSPSSGVHSVKSNVGPPVSDRSMPNTSQTSPSSNADTPGTAIAATRCSMPPSLPRNWREVDGGRQCCHSWPDLRTGSVSAMTALLLTLALITLTAWLGARLYDWIRTDGLGRRAPPRSRHDWTDDTDGYLRSPARRRAPAGGPGRPAGRLGRARATAARARR